MELDDYEKELAASKDPLDYLILQMRLALREKEIEPGDKEWEVVDCKLSYSPVTGMQISKLEVARKSELEEKEKRYRRQRRRSWWGLDEDEEDEILGISDRNRASRRWWWWEYE